MEIGREAGTGQLDWLQMEAAKMERNLAVNVEMEEKSGEVEPLREMGFWQRGEGIVSGSEV